MLHRLVYVSRVAPAAEARLAETVQDILASAVRNNALLNVTGLLLVHQGWFIQALEGGEAAVRTLYKRIGEDLRHRSVTMLTCGPADERLFGAWAMSARMLSDSDKAIHDTLNFKGPFDPSRYSAGAILTLLTTVRDIQARLAA